MRCVNPVDGFVVAVSLRWARAARGQPVNGERPANVARSAGSLSH